MLVFLASLVLAATPTTPTPEVVVSDLDVPRYLRGAELSGWSGARQLYEDGQGLVTRGTSIINTPRTPAKGSGFETPEQAKARGEALVKEGQAKLVRANEALARFRRLAATRFAEMTKSVSETIEISSYPWSEGLLVTTFRAQKVARDAGMTAHHVLGAWSFGADGKPVLNAELVDDLRAAWGKAQGERDFLQPVPTAGYRITPPASADLPPAFAADWKAPTAANQTALVWAEIHSVSAGASLVFVRVADACTLRLLASECFVTYGRGATTTARATVVMHDEHSFLPRVGASGAWRLGYPGESCHPLGAALLRHLSLRSDHIDVYMGALLSDFLGGAARLNDRANATWKIRAVPGSSGNFQVSAQQAAVLAGDKPSTAIEVGMLSLHVESEKSAPKPAETTKPAAK